MAVMHNKAADKAERYIFRDCTNTAWVQILVIGFVQKELLRFETGLLQYLRE